MKNADMPAYPCFSNSRVYDKHSELEGFSDFNLMGGLSKRELIAALAMQGLVSDPQLDARADGVAILAVNYADALLAELEGK